MQLCGWRLLEDECSLLGYVLDRELAMTFEGGEDLDALRADPVDDAVASLDDLAQAGSGKLGHRSAHLGKLRQPLAALDDSPDQALRRSGIGMGDEVLDLDETRERLFCIVLTSACACRPVFEIPPQVSLAHPDRVAHADVRQLAGLAQAVDRDRAHPQ